MPSSEHVRVRFDDTGTRTEEMHSTIEQWAEDLVDGVDDARASDEFQDWLDVQRRFRDYSYRNTLLIKQQCPEATRVAGYRTWQEEFDRHVCEGESAIWIWAPIIAPQCPSCGNSPDYHADSDCEYDETPPDAWNEGPVAFKPVPVFDVSQTEGEPLPELDTEAEGDGTALRRRLCAAADPLDLSVSIIEPAAWTHGEAAGVCKPSEASSTDQPEIRVQDRSDDAAVAGTLVHEYAHARLHVGVDDDTERRCREVEAEAVAYIVGRYFGLDMSGSAFYLAAWQADEPDLVLDRLDRISTTSRELIEVLEA